LLLDGAIVCTFDFPPFSRRTSPTNSWVMPMTNPDDRWRHQTSAAPHAPSHDPLTPGLPLQGQPAMNIGGSDDASAYPVNSGPGVNIWVLIAGGFIVLIFSGPIFGTLYPLAAVPAAMAYFAVKGALHVVMPNLDVNDQRPFALLATIVVFWFMSRVDHRLAARVAAYRLTRHVARVFLIAAFLTPSTISEPGRNGWMPRSAFELQLLVTDRRVLVAMAFWMVVAHLLLVRAKGTRAKWDRVLELVRLRPKGL
jgi:hypothetical protein